MIKLKSSLSLSFKEQNVNLDSQNSNMFNEGKNLKIQYDKREKENADLHVITISLL